MTRPKRDRRLLTSSLSVLLFSFFFFFFNDPATTEIYTLSLHDALPIYLQESGILQIDRKSTRLNSSH